MGKMDSIQKCLVYAFGAMLALHASSATAKVWYVKWDATGANSGNTWTDAFASLQSALSAAQSGDEIWVAAGTYKPSQRTDPLDARSATFRLVSSVKAFGGFAGTETSRLQRDFRTKVTTLSGDLNGDDGANWSNIADNTWHVFRAIGTDVSTVLDGFTVMGGNSIGAPSVETSGAGCWITNGGIAIANCTFTKNTSDASGGGAYLDGATARVFNCRFVTNRNSVGAGGGLRVSGGDALIVNCVFTNNSTVQLGGGIFLDGAGSRDVINCSFYGNTAGVSGGGINMHTPNGRVRNCALWDNTAPSGSNIYAWSTIDVQYTTLPGGWPGAGNLAANPLFFDADGPDNLLGTLDDDLQLQPGSRCIDAGNNSALPADVLDLNGNGSVDEPLPLDLAGQTRRFDNPCRVDTGSGTSPVVDMGAYEAPYIATIPSPLYVKADAIGTRDGSSWANACTSLQSALDLIRIAGCDSVEVWVAAGTYKPSALTIPSDPRSASFELVSGTAIYGGFAGTETSRLQRDFLANLTILSGDLNGDDGPNWLNNGDNAYHVLRATATGSATRLDGVLVTSGNSAGAPGVETSGAGLFASGGGVTLANCTFWKNHAAWSGGGVYLSDTSARVFNCRFLSNCSEASGGGMRANSPGYVIANCLFVNNSTASGYGGGLFLQQPVAGDTVNCTFHGNVSSQYGGGLGVFSPNGRIRNCVFANNSAPSGPQIYNGTAVEVQYSCVSGGWAGVGNMSSDPLFINPLGADGILGSLDDDFQLQSTSPCIDAGDNSALPTDTADLDSDRNRTEPTPLDLAGHPRRIEAAHSAGTGSGEAPLVDMGAYESAFDQPFVFPNPAGVVEGSSLGIPVHLAWEPSGPITVSISFVSGDTRLSIVSGSILTFDQDNFKVPQPVVIVAPDDVEIGDTTATFRLTAPGRPDALLTVQKVDNDSGTVLYVRADASPNGDGLSWDSAFQDLELALLAVRRSGGLRTQVWVAAGTYKPSALTIPLDPRSASFELVSGTTIYGGFAGTESSLSQRDFLANLTILSGDLSGDDGPNWENSGDNAYHVLKATNASISTTLDGVTVMGGNSMMGAPVPETAGAGLYVVNGGATIVNCSFWRNRALGSGGGIMFSVGKARVFNCRFLSNTCDGSGGAVRVNGGTAEIANCLFVNNAAAGYYGGGALELDVTAIQDVLNCTFYGNTTSQFGGGIGMYSANGRIRNCVFKDNSALYGAQIYDGSGSCAVSYSCVQGGYGGVGNISSDPLFINPPGADGILGSLDDDFQLQSTSPCIDAGDNGAVLVGVDLLRNTRRADAPDRPDIGSGAAPLVDMGSHEFGANALPARLYVKAATLGAQTGENWISAMPVLGLALITTEVAGGRVAEIWIAQGTYIPESTFRLPNGVALYGGFTGTENALELRNSDPTTNGTVLRGTGTQNHVVDSSGASGSGLDGFTISGGNASESDPNDHGGGLYLGTGRPTLNNLRLVTNSALTEAGGFFAAYAYPQLNNLIIGTNSAPRGNAGVLATVQCFLAGAITMTGGTLESPSTLELRSSRFEGPGHVDLGHYSKLHITNSPIYDPSRLLSDVTGTGTIEIATGQYLVVGGSAVVDLSGDGQCRPGLDDRSRGRIDVKGSLIVQDTATIQNTKVDVTLAEFKGSNDIVNNNIKLLEASTGFGGEFFAGGQATVRCNTILSEGDRYLDLDPDPIAPERPTIADNLIYVKIKEGILGSQGTLLELRTQDHDLAVGQGHSGAYKLASSPGYADTWVLEEVEILPGAKLNLTNRQGFEFQPPSISEPETVYVKKLKLHPGAVLNTALQRLYYQELVDEHDQPLDPAKLPDATGRQLLDLPLLGFSLAIIRMDDTNEFGIRTRLRTRDDQDTQPQPPAPALEGSIERLDEGDGGLMEMRTQAEGRQSASSIAAKGSFSRAGEETVVVSFDYRFVNAGEANDAEIIVKLSDKPEVGTSNYEVGRVRPPTPGQPGAVGSSDYALYYIEVPYEEWSAHLGRFNRGTYVELELRGKGAVVRIDNWDPQVICSYTCADFTKNGVSTDDFLILLAEYGRSPAQTGHSCLDMYLSRDQHLDLTDLLSWDTYVAGGFNSCTAGGVTLSYAEPTKPPITTATFAPRSFVISGKPKTAGDQQDRIYTFNASGAQTGSQNPWTQPSLAPVGYRGNGRLIRDGQGNVYQLHAKQGLVRATDGVAVVPPKSRDTGGLKWQNRPVSVGVTSGTGTSFTGVPLTDAVFDPKDPNAVYVTPVLVWVASPAHVYRATAKLILDPNQPGQYSLAAVYGADPWTDPLATTTSPPEASYSATRLRELEIDRTGTRLFVTSSRADNGNEWLLIYDLQGGTEARHRLTSLAASLKSPTAMLASSRSDKLYLASADQGSAWRLYRLDISGSSPVYEGELVLPAPQVGHARQVTTISEDANSGKLLLLGFELPVFPDTKTFLNSDALFTTPLLLTITPADAWSTSGIQTTPLSGSDLALPVSMVYVGGNSPADFNNDGRVDSTDLEIFAACATGPGILYNPAALPEPSPGCTLPPDAQGKIAADFDRDSDVDQADFGVFQRCYSDENHLADPACAE